MPSSLSGSTTIHPGEGRWRYRFVEVPSLSVSEAWLCKHHVDEPWNTIVSSAAILRAAGALAVSPPWIRIRNRRLKGMPTCDQRSTNLGRCPNRALGRAVESSPIGILPSYSGSTAADTISTGGETTLAWKPPKRGLADSRLGACDVTSPVSNLLLRDPASRAAGSSLQRSAAMT